MHHPPDPDIRIPCQTMGTEPYAEDYAPCRGAIARSNARASTSPTTSA